MLEFKDDLHGNDPGAPKNPRIFKKFLITTLITSIIFAVIYYLTANDYLNLRRLFTIMLPIQSYFFL